MTDGREASSIRDAPPVWPVCRSHRAKLPKPEWPTTFSRPVLPEQDRRAAIDNNENGYHHAQR
jgi:hypothetical protein